MRIVSLGNMMIGERCRTWTSSNIYISDICEWPNVTTIIYIYNSQFDLPIWIVWEVKRAHLAKVWNQTANSYFPRYLGVYLCISRLYLYVGNGNKAAVRNEMHSFLWSCKVTSIGPMKCPLLYDGWPWALSQTQAGHIWGYVLCMSHRIPIRTPHICDFALMSRCNTSALCFIEIQEMS